MDICPHCNKEYKSLKTHIWRVHGEGKNHNPNKGYLDGSRVAWNKGLNKDVDSRVKKNGESLKLSYNGVPKGCCSSEYLGSQKHKESSSKGGGYRENAGRSKKFKVLDSFGALVTLQSSYELECSILLNSMNINWIRPKALKYDNRNYFADFYLPDYDIWLDPKNDYKARCDSDKIKKVISQNGIKLYVLLHKQITKEYIIQLLSSSEEEQCVDNA